MKGLAPRRRSRNWGDFGYHFACELHALGHECWPWTAMRTRCSRFCPTYTKAAIGRRHDPRGARGAESRLLRHRAVCVGERLETAVLLVHHLHQLQIPLIVVKVANQEQGDNVKLVGPSEVIHPEQSTARKAPRMIHHPPRPRLPRAGRRTTDHRRAFTEQRRWENRANWIFRSVTAIALLESGKPVRTTRLSPPAPGHTIAESDVLIQAGGRLDRLRN